MVCHGCARSIRGALVQDQAGRRVDAFLDRHGKRAHQSAGCGMVQPRNGTWLRPLVWLLVHGLPGRPARHGRRFDERRAADSLDRSFSQDALSLAGNSPRSDRHRVTDSRLHNGGRRAGLDVGVPQGAGLIPVKLDPGTGAPIRDKQGHVQLDYGPRHAQHAAPLLPYRESWASD